MAGLPWARMAQYHDCTNSQGSNDNISRDEWLINIRNTSEDTTNRRIERVPSMLRKFEVESNRKCYDPLIVSIGPYHHGKLELKAVETVKLLYAKKFLYGSCGGDQASIIQLYEEVANLADDAREFYEKRATEKYDKESFTRMMFLDACFVLQFMYYFKIAETGSNNSNKKDTAPKEVDPLLKMKSYQIAFVWRDLFLLENQIPLSVLKVFFKFICKGEELIQNFLNRTIIMPQEQTSCTNAVKNLFGICFKGDQEKQELPLPLDDSPHLLDLMWRQLTGPRKQIMNEPDHWYSNRSVTELEAAGIDFKASKTHRVTDVKFKDHLVYGTMMIPPLMIDDGTKSLLLNLVAYETKLDDSSGSPITSYICLMDSLIDHANDVKELRRKGIILNNLGSDEHLAELFNEIADNLVPDPRAYADVKVQIKKHCGNIVRVWIAEWWHNHFSSPWTILAFLAATFVLALTVVQTYFSVFPPSD